MLDLETISVLIFFFVITLLLIKDRKNIKFSYGVIVRRWERGREAIDRFVKKYRKIIKPVGIFAICVCVLASVVTFSYLFYCLVSPQLRGKCFALLLPTVGEAKYPEQLPVISPRFWYWILAIFIVIASHESMHAIYARAENVQIKNYGLILFLFFPLGAFVDPNMQQVKKLSFTRKLRIYAAGSFGNFFAALIVFLFSILLGLIIYQLFSYPAGVMVGSLINKTPAFYANLSGIILEINGSEIKNLYDLATFLNKTKPEQNLTIKTTERVFLLQTIKHPEIEGRGFIGIRNLDTAFKWKYFDTYQSENFRISSSIFFTLLGWIFIANLGIGMANLLPIRPLDGGLIFEEFARKIFKERGEAVTRFVTSLTLFLIIANFLVTIF
ncbi:MAG: site-2 protease family protein [Candidatus Aenigmarchaeota archaeon]|nr:site-2 protease family protein [Candidatus Aenigmarchaeota archaeon]